MVRRDWTTKPNYDVWRDLVFRQWWTEESGRTASDGAFRVRGFRGDYEIEVTSGELALRQPAHLGSEGASLSVRLQ